MRPGRSCRGSLQTSHDKTCTVSRTIEAGTPVTAVVE